VYARQEVTIAEAKTLRDDRQVTLTGTISGRADNDHYGLKDSTGHIRVDIDVDDEDDRYLIGKRSGLPLKLTAMMATAQSMQIVLLS